MLGHTGRQIAIIADIRTEGRTYCSIRCQYCKRNRVQLLYGDDFTVHWVHNWCLLFKEKLYGHNSKFYPKRRPKCVRYTLHAEVLLSLYAAAKDILSVGELDSVHEPWSDAFMALEEAINQVQIWKKQLDRDKDKGV